MNGGLGFKAIYQLLTRNVPCQFAIEESGCFVSNSTVICLGELLIDFIPLTNGLPLSEVPEFRRVAGGAPANVAAAVARLGGESRFIGKVGNDAFGDHLESVLKQCGVETMLFRTDEAKTTLAFVSLREDGEREFSFYRNPGADMLLSKDEITIESLASGSVFHFGSVSLVAEPSRSATIHAAQLAHLQGLIVSYDPNVRLSLWPSPEEAKRVIRDTLSLAHIVKVNEEEAVFLTGYEDQSRAAGEILEYGPQAVIITNGEKGSSMWIGGRSIHVPAIPVNAVDTTGAGDAFVGALLFQLSRSGWPASNLAKQLSKEPVARDILRFANAAGSIVATRRGAIPSMPTEAEVRQVLG
jgi:fructokinase